MVLVCFELLVYHQIIFYRLNIILADQIYGDEEMHDDVRRLCMDYIVKFYQILSLYQNFQAQNRDHFSQFVTEDFEAYLRRKREPDAHGNHVELQAISEIYSRPIEIYEYSIGLFNYQAGKGIFRSNQYFSPDYSRSKCWK